MASWNFGFTNRWADVERRRRERGLSFFSLPRARRRRRREEEEDLLPPVPEPLTPLTVADPSPIPERRQSEAAFTTPRDSFSEAPVPSMVPAYPRIGDEESRYGPLPDGRLSWNRALRGDDEDAYQAWAQRLGLESRPYPHGYDYRGAYRAGIREPGPQGHWPSDFKDPEHPTNVVGGFSVFTKERVPGTPRLGYAGLVENGWRPEAALELSKKPEYPTYGIDADFSERAGPSPWGARGERSADQTTLGRISEDIPSGYVRDPRTGRLVQPRRDEYERAPIVSDDPMASGMHVPTQAAIDRTKDLPSGYVRDPQTGWIVSEYGTSQIYDQESESRINRAVDLIMAEDRRALDAKAGMLRAGDAFELTQEEEEREFSKNRERVRQRLLKSDKRLTSLEGLGEYGFDENPLSFNRSPAYWENLADDALVQRAGLDAAGIEASIDEIDKQLDILNWRTLALVNDPEGTEAIEARWPEVDWTNIARQSNWIPLLGGGAIAFETARRARLKEDRFLLLTMLNDKQTPAMREAISRAYGVDISPERSEEDIVKDYRKAREEAQRTENLSPAEREAAEKNREVLDEKGQDINDPLWQSMRDEETSVGIFGDFGVTLGSMLPLLAQSAFNVADMPTGGAVSRAFEKLGYDPVEQQEWNEEFFSEAMRAGQRDFEDAEGMMETLSSLMGGSYPGQVGLSMAIQQVPNIFLARGVGQAVVSPALKGVARAARGVKATRLARRASRLADNPLWMGAIGEGTISAAESASEIREAAEEGEDISFADWMSVPLTGVSTAVLGRFGAWVASKAGINDIDSLFIKGTRKLTKTGKDWTRNIIVGAVQEGFFEELPQSVMEQVLLNQALGRPLDEGVEKAAVAGAVLGAGMGAAMQALNFPRRGVKRDEWYRERDRMKSIVEPRREELIKKGATESDIDKAVKDVDLAAFGRLREVDPELGDNTAHKTGREAYVIAGMKAGPEAPVEGINLSNETVESLVERQEDFDGENPMRSPLQTLRMGLILDSSPEGVNESSEALAARILGAYEMVGRYQGTNSEDIYKDKKGLPIQQLITDLQTLGIETKDLLSKKGNPQNTKEARQKASMRISGWVTNQTEKHRTFLEEVHEGTVRAEMEVNPDGVHQDAFKSYIRKNAENPNEHVWIHQYPDKVKEYGGRPRKLTQEQLDKLEPPSGLQLAARGVAQRVSRAIGREVREFRGTTATVEEQDQTIKTGKPVTLSAIRRIDEAPAPKDEDLQQQRLEPREEGATSYLLAASPDVIAGNEDPGIEAVQVSFERPLVIPFNDVNEQGNTIDSYNETSWKQKLSDEYGGKTGADLVQALRDDRFDGIITTKTRKGVTHTSEIIALSRGESVETQAEYSKRILDSDAAQVQQGQREPEPAVKDPEKPSPILSGFGDHRLSTIEGTPLIKDLTDGGVNRALSELYEQRRAIKETPAEEGLSAVPSKEDILKSLDQDIRFLEADFSARERDYWNTQELEARQEQRELEKASETEKEVDVSDADVSDAEAGIVEAFTFSARKPRSLSYQKILDRMILQDSPDIHKLIDKALASLEEQGLVSVKTLKDGTQSVSFKHKTYERLTEERRVAEDLRRNALDSAIEQQRAFEEKLAENDPGELADRDVGVASFKERQTLGRKYIKGLLLRLQSALGGKNGQFPAERTGNQVEPVDAWVKRVMGKGKSGTDALTKAVKNDQVIQDFLRLIRERGAVIRINGVPLAMSVEHFIDQLNVAQGNVGNFYRAIEQSVTDKDGFNLGLSILGMQSELAKDANLVFMAKENALLHQRIFRGVDPKQPFGGEPKEYRLPLKDLQAKYQRALTSLETTDKDGRPVYSTGLVKKSETKGEVIKANVVNGILEARLQIVIAWRYNNTLPSDLEKVVGKGEARRSEFFKHLQAWTNEAANNTDVKQAIRDIEGDINEGVPETSRWRGMSNLVLMQAMSDGDASLVNENKIHQIVKNIRIVDPAVTEKQHLGNSDEATKSLRENLLRSFMAIDSLIDYSDLEIVIQSIAKEHRGEYDPSTKELRISDPKNFVHTIPHELGHYLAHKWINEAIGGENFHKSLFSFGSAEDFNELLEGRRSRHEEATGKNNKNLGEPDGKTHRSKILDRSNTSPTVSESRLRWMNEARGFVDNLQNLASTSDTDQGYWGSSDEVFARFVSDFVAWAEWNALDPARDIANHYAQDKWGDWEFEQFASLLQSKQMVDERDSNPFGSDYATRGIPFNYDQWMEKLPDPVMARLVHLGSLLLASGVTSEKEFRQKFSEMLRSPVNLSNLGFASDPEFAEDKLRELDVQIDAMESDLLIPSLRHGIYKLPVQSRDYPTSKGTSVNKAGAGLALHTAVQNKKKEERYEPLEGIFKKGGKNLDVGAGIEEPLTALLEKDGVTNFPLDPYNQPARLVEVIDEIRKGMDDPTMYLGVYGDLGPLYKNHNLSKGSKLGLLALSLARRPKDPRNPTDAEKIEALESAGYSSIFKKKGGVVTDKLRGDIVKKLEHSNVAGFVQEYLERKAVFDERRKTRQAARFDTATLSNVLNVIKSGDIRSQVIQQAASALKDDGVLLVTVYEKSGKAKLVAPDPSNPKIVEWEGGGETKTKGGKSWQENRKTETYIEELKAHFDTVTQHGIVLKAENPKRFSRAENMIQQQPAFRDRVVALEKAWASRDTLLEQAGGLVSMDPDARAEQFEKDRKRDMAEGSPYQTFHLMKAQVDDRRRKIAEDQQEIAKRTDPKAKLKVKPKLSPQELVELFGNEEKKKLWENLLARSNARINRRRISGGRPVAGHTQESLRYPAVFERHINKIFTQAESEWTILKDKIHLFQSRVAPVQEFIRTPVDEKGKPISGAKQIVAQLMSTRVPFGIPEFKSRFGITDQITDTLPADLEAYLGALGLSKDDESLLYTRLRKVDEKGKSTGEKNVRLSPGMVKSLVGSEVMKREVLREDSPYKDYDAENLKTETLPLTIFKESDLKKVGPGPKGWSVEQLIEETMVEAMKENLTTIYENYPKALRERAKQWYEGANKISFDLTAKYNELYKDEIASGSMRPLDENQVAAILASLSPQADWNQNIARADRLIAIHRQFDASPNQTFNKDIFSAYIKGLQSSLSESIKARKSTLKKARDESTDKYKKEWSNYQTWESDLRRDLMYESDVFGVKLGLEVTLGLDAKGNVIGKKDDPAKAIITGPQDPEWLADFKEISWKYPENAKDVRMTAELKAKMVRAYEESQYSPEYQDETGKWRRITPKYQGGGAYLVYSPEGESTGRMDMNKPKVGKPMVQSKMTWGSFDEIAKAISLMEDGSAANISQQIGWGHKVRSFYDNIIAPEYAGAVTIDTHAIGAALLQAVGSKDDIVKLTMGSLLSPEEGIRGLNPVVAEAYFQTAEALGIKPRELQSVTWEATRSLFPTELKKGATEDVLDSKGQPVKDDETGKTKTVDVSLSTFTKDAWTRYQRGEKGYRTTQDVFNKIAENAQRLARKDADNKFETYGQDSRGRRIFRSAAWSDAKTATPDDKSGVSVRDEPSGAAAVPLGSRLDPGSPAVAGRSFTGKLGRVLGNDQLFLRRRDQATEGPKVRPTDYPRLDTTTFQYVEQLKSQLVRFLGHMTASADMSIDGPPRFYSELANLIRTKTTNRKGDIQKTVRRDEVLAWVRDPKTQNPKNGVKSDELDFLGFDLWVQTQGPLIKREDILHYVENNTIDIVEFTNYPFDPGQSHERLREGVGLSPDEQLARTSQRALVPASPLYREWTVEGGFNYRVMALVWRPRGNEFDERFTDTHQLFDHYTPESIDGFDTRGFMAQPRDVQRLRDFINFYIMDLRRWDGENFEDAPLSVEAIRREFPQYSDVLSQFESVDDFTRFLDGYERASSPPHPGANVLGWVRMTDRVTPVYTTKDVENIWEKLRTAIEDSGFFSSNEGELEFNQQSVWKIDAQIKGEKNEAVRAKLSEEAQRLEKKTLGVIQSFTRENRRDWVLLREMSGPVGYQQKLTPFMTPDLTSDRHRAESRVPTLEALVESGVITEREKILITHDAEYTDARELGSPSSYKPRYVGSHTARDFGLERTQLLIEEVQSDWHQAPYRVLEQMANRYGSLLHWRKDVLEDADQLAHVDGRIENFPLPREVREQIEQNFNAGEELHKGLDPRLAFYEFGPGGILRSTYENELGDRGPLEVPRESRGDIPERHRSRHTFSLDKPLVADAPLKRQWVMNAMRRVIRRGVEGGYDSVAWTDAETQRERWTRQAMPIAGVEWFSEYEPETKKHDRKMVRLSIKTSGESQQAVLYISSTGTILDVAPSGDQKFVSVELADFWKLLHGETLNRVISGEVQKKVLGSAEGSIVPKEGTTALINESAFSGFYDGKLRNDLRRYLKQWGIEPQHGHIGVEHRRRLPYVLEAAGVWSFDINDQMRSGVMQKGDPYYDKKDFNEEVLRNVAKEQGLTYDEMLQIAKEEGWNVIRSAQSFDEDVTAEAPVDDGSPEYQMKKGVLTKKGRDPRDPKQVTDDDGKPLVPAGDIIHKLAAALGNIPVNIGRTFGARGKQNKDTKSIWVQIADELDVFAHEIGHHIHQSLFSRTTKKNKKVERELYALGATTAHSEASRERRIQEGAAEFFRFWSHHPEMAKELAPEYYKAFESQLKKLEPPLRNALKEFQNDYVRLYDANPEERAATRISFGIESSPFIQHSDMLLQWESRWINDLAPMKRAVREMEAIARGDEAGLKDPRLLRSRGRLEDVLGEEDMPEMILDNAFRMAELAKGSAMKARGFLDHGVQDRAGKLINPRTAQGNKKKAFWDRVTGKKKHSGLGGGLPDAWEPVLAEARKLGIDEKQHLEDFSKYLVFRHMPEVELRGKATGIESVGAKRWMAKNETEAFKEAAQNIYDFQNALLEYAKDEGMINQELVNRLRNAYKFYVPFRRVIHENEAHGFAGASQKVRQFMGSGKVVMAMKGSGRQIINPLESIVKNTFETVKLVENNKALQILTDQADRVKPGSGLRGTSPWLERVTAPREHIVVPRDVANIKKALDKAGYDIGEDVNLDALIHVFRPRTTPTHPDEFTVLKNGERVFYRVNNPALMDAITGFGESNPVLFNAIFAGPAQLLRRTATATFEFMFRNPIRDTYQAFTTSRHGYKPWEIFGGLWEIFRTTKFGRRMGLTESGMYRAFMNSGAGGHTLGSLNRNTVQEQLRRYDQVQRRNFFISIPSTLLEVLVGTQEALENATRLGEFTRAVRKLEAQGVSMEEVYARAAYSAAEVTVNFKRSGSQAKAWNKWKSFFNASLQGKVRLAELFTRDPKGALIRALGSVTPLSIALWFINADDPDYEELPRWEKDAYWHIPLGKGRDHPWMRIPKPWDLAHIFGNIPEAMLDFMYSYKKNGEMTQEEWDEFVVGVMGKKEDIGWNVAGLVIPTAIMPGFEVLTNRSLFRRGPIVNIFDEKIAPELQANRYTSQTARYIAEKLDTLGGIKFGAAKIDHLIQGHTAGIGKYVTDTIDTGIHFFSDPAVPPTPLRGESYGGIAPTRIWGVRGITRGGASSGSAASLVKFFEEREKIQGIRKSIDDFKETNQHEKADRLREDHREVLKPSYLTKMNEVSRKLRRDKNTLDKLYTQSYGFEPAKVWDVPGLYKRHQLTRAERIKRGKRVEKLWGDMINHTRRFFGKDQIS